ncbi:HNH endonuclease [Comamonas sediminis]|uniref:HNH endonuclease n=1 Tax=Comamonas sediminis TaxID=1783360 RepID=UPI003D2A1672
MRNPADGIPEYWTDHNGRAWLVPQILGRLKPGKCPGHLALREFVIARDGHKCVRCNSTDNLVADHIISRRNGGSHHPDNLQCLCQSCNARKSNLEDRRHA